jgi:ribonuclease R
LARKPAPGKDALTRDAVLAHIRDQETPVGIRELARAFDAKGKQRTALRLIVKELTEEGLIEAPDRRKFAAAGRMPKVTVIEITGTDPDGELKGRPARWPADQPVPDIFIAPLRGRPHPFAEGERILARLKPNPDGSFDATTLHRIGVRPTEVIGMIERTREGLRLRPADKRARDTFSITASSGSERAAGSKQASGTEPAPGSLVRARVVAARGGGRDKMEVVEHFGDFDAPGAIGLLTLHANGVPMDFPDAALAAADRARAPELGKRRDLRETPLVTIDDEDARDFDDAVFAEPDPAPGNEGGFRIIVAIADVAWFVRPGDALDREAQKRGNSVYLPDRVVPMLPEGLSAGLCSLKPDEDRAVLTAEMRIKADGTLIAHRFDRALMRSAARLTYRQAQAFRDGIEDPWGAGLSPDTVAALFAAHDCLSTARRARGTLELELPEYKVALDDKGRVTEIVQRPRFTSHRLIEEFMIAANVAAAETLERRRVPCMYRVHEPPGAAKLEALREFLTSFGLQLPRGQVLRAQQFADILARAANDPSAEMIHESVLRTQSQAAYSPHNLGHFGLALRRYAHFTSPIRRYADLMVHRGLISALGLGEGGLGAGEGDEMDEVATHISDTERRAKATERDALERHLARYLENRVGSRMEGRITGVSRFGLFVRLKDTGAEGIVPARLLGDERFDHDENRHTLKGRVSGRVYTLGDTVEVLLREASGLTGGLVLTLAAHRAARGQHRKRWAGKTKPGKAKPGPAKRRPTKRKSRRR